MIKYFFNVKKGDMLYTNLGSVLLTGEEGSRWHYVMNGKTNSIKKTTLWKLIDTRSVRVSYANGKKHRTKQRKFRTLDLRTKCQDEHVKLFDEFLNFVNIPYNIIYSLDNSRSISYIKEVMEKTGKIIETKQSGSDVVLTVKENKNEKRKSRPPKTL